MNSHDVPGSVKESSSASVEVISISGGEDMAIIDGNALSIAAAVLQRYGGSVVASTAIAIVLAVGLIAALAGIKELDEDEPQALKSRLPLFGHLLGMLRWQVGYMQMLRYFRKFL